MIDPFVKSEGRVGVSEGIDRPGSTERVLFETTLLQEGEKRLLERSDFRSVRVTEYETVWGEDPGP